MQLKKLKDIIKSIGTPNKDDTLLGVFGGKTAQKSIEDILKVTDYTVLRNLPRTLCSGTLELTATADGGYEAIAETSITYNGVEKFKLDKGNLLFLKDGTVNIQNGYGCYCIDDIPNKVDVDWTDYYGTTNVDIDNLKKDIDNRYQNKIVCRNGISIDEKQHRTLSLQNGSTVLKKANMTTAITASGRYDIAESGDVLIGFPGTTDFTPFTLKVNKGDIIKFLFDTEKNVTDVLYIGDISQNYDELTINNAAQKGYFKNSFFDITAFELSVHTDGNCYQQTKISEFSNDNCISFGHNLYDLTLQNLNIPSGRHRLLASTTKKDENKNPIYEFVSMDNGLMLVSSDMDGHYPSSKLTIVPAQLNMSESNITYEHEGTNDETLKAFAENVYSYIDDCIYVLQAKVEALEKAVASPQTNAQSEVTT